MDLSIESLTVSPVTSVLLLILFITLLVKSVKAYKRWCFFQRLPGIKDYSFLFGNLQHLPKSPQGRTNFALDQMKKYNLRFHRFWVGPISPHINIYHPESMKQVIQATSDKPHGIGSAYRPIGQWIGHGLIVANGPHWARSRRLLTPAFHFDILKGYFQVYNQAANHLFEKLDKLAETGHSFDIYPLMTLCTLEVILKCSLGYNGDVQRNGHPYATTVSELSRLIHKRVMRPWLSADFIYRRTADGKQFYQHCDYVHRFAEDIIEKRKDSLEKEGVPTGRRLDFIDLLLTAQDEDGKAMTNQEIRNEVDTFMFAGHDTTASAIPWCLFALATHPEWQERIQKEVDNLLDGRDSDEILMQDIPNLPTLAICVKESLRLFPPVPFIQRRLHTDTEICGQMIPSGTNMNLSIIALHQNPEVWDQPAEFLPERFLTENKKAQENFSFIPFSAGARNCIGQNFALNEDKVMVARILRRYTVEVASDKPLAVKNPNITLRAENGIWLALRLRNN